jgi:phosphoglycerol transferase MdoB-like AlkP superfamily enzyme
MQIASIDSVDILLIIFFPPIGTLIVYGGAYAAARVVTGGQPLSQPTRTILRYGSFFVLGMGYLIMILGTLKLPDASLWVSVVIWAVLVVWFALWRRRRDKQSES